MKFRNLFFTVLATLALSAGFVSCSDDDDEGSNASFNGQKLQKYAFVLNEGAYKKNNAGISCFGWDNNKVISEDIYLAQNKQALGDTGQDIVTDGNGNVFVVVYGSAYVAKLNEEGVETARADYTAEPLAEYGQPRYAVVEGGKLYVTAYGGYVTVFNTKDLKLERVYKVGQNPEHIIAYKGKIYNTNSGWGTDNTVSEYNPASQEVKTYTVMSNPDGILECNGRIFVQGYGKYDENWVAEYPWGELDLSTGEFKEIGKASSWAAFNGVVYTIHSETDWNTMTTVNHFASYNTKNNELTEGSFLKNAPAELPTSSIFAMQFNPFNGNLYVTTSNFVTDGNIHVFDKNFNYVTSFNANGVNPRKIAFFK